MVPQGRTAFARRAGAGISERGSRAARRPATRTDSRRQEALGPSQQSIGRFLQACP